MGWDGMEKDGIGRHETAWDGMGWDAIRWDAMEMRWDGIDSNEMKQMG